MKRDGEWRRGEMYIAGERGHEEVRRRSRVHADVDERNAHECGHNREERAASRGHHHLHL
jgi:hypothetical protein